uniref:Kinesin-like protein n=1 Tax=Rhabditophanes sp. KR3021 TaxID=114890 RepID=A0AC35TU35_9BILA
MNILCEGMNVDIKRSDGRVHGACISKVNEHKSAVHVEWYEGGETKGKELPIKTILSTNPMLAQMYQKACTNAMTASTLSNDFGSGGVTKGLNTPAEEPSIRPNGKTSVKNTMFVAPTDFSKKLVDQTVLYDEEAVRRELNAEFHHPSNGLRMPAKSQTVISIEKLAKEREERRARQQEEKKQKEKIDDKNPNWEYYKLIRDYQASLNFRPTQSNGTVGDKKIAVCVRVRPLSDKETKRNEIEVVSTVNCKSLIVHQPQSKVDTTKFIQNSPFDFDCVFDEHSGNEDVYKATIQPLIQTFFEQGFVTCFAYGQTGSGKTFTMSGAKGGAENNSSGIYGRTAKEIFDRLNHPSLKRTGMYIDCAFFEIYGNKAYDLLNNRTELRVLADNKDEVQIMGLKVQKTISDTEVLAVIRKGILKRVSGQTSANATSSRSHAIFQFLLKTKDDKVYGKFSLVDLAGNERGADTGTSDIQTRREGAAINKSLLALKECIRHMSDPTKDHVPFRNSSLTQFLKDSFIGKNSKLCMIAMISPAIGSCEATLNTLRYAFAVKQLLGETDMMEDDGQDFEVYDDPLEDAKYAAGSGNAFQQNSDEKIEECKDVVVEAVEKTVKKINLLSSNFERFVARGKKGGQSGSEVESYSKDLANFVTLFKEQTASLTSELEQQCTNLNECLQLENRKPNGTKQGGRFL